MSSVEVRAGVNADFPLWQEWTRKLFDSDGRFDPDFNQDWPDEPAGREYFATVIQSGILLFAERDGRVLGFLDGTLHEANATTSILRAEITQIFVERESRRQGVGNALVAQFAGWCRQRSVKSMVVGVFDANREAVAFYRSLGLAPWIVRLSGAPEQVLGG